MPQNSDIWYVDVPLSKSIVSDDTLSDLLTQSQGMLILSQSPFEKSIFCRMCNSGQIWILFAGSMVGILLSTMMLMRREKNK
jgi:hypothetical protein